MNDQSRTEETLPNGQPSSGAQESGAGYGNAQAGSDAHHGDPEQADQAVQRSETIEAEDIAMDKDLIDEDE